MQRAALLISDAGAYLRKNVWPVRQSDRSGRLSRLFKAQRLPKSNFPLRYNVAPTDQIPIVRIDPRDGEREVVMARWGLIPFWMKEKPKVPHINARAETVHKLPLFREAFAKRRCLIPATGFYEWQKREDGKQPYRFRHKDLEPFAFAGMWEFARLGGEDILSTAMIVGEANPLVGAVHDRMPVMLMSEDNERWLGPTTGIDDLKAMLKPYDPALMEAYAVNRAVNSVFMKDPKGNMARRRSIIPAHIKRCRLAGHHDADPKALHRKAEGLPAFARHTSRSVVGTRNRLDLQLRELLKTVIVAYSEGA